MFIGTRVLVYICASLFIFSGADASQRVALVIGNSNYEHVEHLPNTRNDAGDIAGALTRLGFQVSQADNLTFSQMRRQLAEFSSRAATADMAVVFFAGHGLEVNKQNFLVPTDAKLATDRAVQYEAIPLEMVTAAVEEAKGLKLIILDACRQNPFVKSMALTTHRRSIGRGLARIEPLTGTLVAYAAREGTVAYDGTDRNSPYTKALLAYLERPNLEIAFLFRKVRDAVMAETANQQQPFTYGSLPGKEIYLKIANVSNATKGDVDSDQQRPSSVRTLFPKRNITECDRLGADPEDVRALTSGVSNQLIMQNPQPAIAACKIALSTYPDDPLLNYQIGRAYRWLKNEKEAVIWLTRAARLQHPQAMYTLGFLYQIGFGVERSEQNAIDWYAKAADFGHVAAMRDVARHHGINKNYIEMINWLTIAAKSGDSHSMDDLSQFYEGSGFYEGSEKFKDKQKAFEWKLRAAESGSHWSALKLADAYRDGKGAENSLEKAVHWYKQAAGLGNAVAMHRLGELYRPDKGVLKDGKESFKWAFKAANPENPFFKANASGPHARLLGLHYYHGWGTASDFSKAANWFKVAADRKDAWSAYTLGKLYLWGKGVAKDHGKAVKLMLQSLRLDGSYGVQSEKFVEWFIEDRGTISKDAWFEVQRHLTESGVYRGPINGIFGEETKAALYEYARNHARRQ